MADDEIQADRPDPMDKLMTDLHTGVRRAKQRRGLHIEGMSYEQAMAAIPDEGLDVTIRNIKCGPVLVMDERGHWTSDGKPLTDEESAALKQAIGETIVDIVTEEAGDG